MLTKGRSLILQKKGALNEEEFSIMKTHTTLGANALLEAIRHQENNSALMYAKEIAEYHHERWDGSGYPQGLSCREIPLTARVMAVADVFDALQSKRSYKEALSHDTSVDIIAKGAGTQFDPEIVEKFLKHEKEFYSISDGITDNGSTYK